MKSLHHMLLGGALVIALAAAPVHAQMGLGQEPDASSGGAGGAIDQTVRPPKIEEPDGSGRWLYYITFVACGALVVGLAVMPSKRTHQD